MNEATKALAWGLIIIGIAAIALSIPASPVTYGITLIGFGISTLINSAGGGSR